MIQRPAGIYGRALWFFEKTFLSVGGEHRGDWVCAALPCHGGAVRRRRTGGMCVRTDVYGANRPSDPRGMQAMVVGCRVLCLWHAGCGGGLRGVTSRGNAFPLHGQNHGWHLPCGLRAAFRKHPYTSVKKRALQSARVCFDGALCYIACPIFSPQRTSIST